MSVCVAGRTPATLGDYFSGSGDPSQNILTPSDVSCYETLSQVGASDSNSSFVWRSELSCFGGLVPHELRTYYTSPTGAEHKGHPLSKHVIDTDGHGYGHKSRKEFRAWAIDRWSGGESGMQSAFLNEGRAESWIRKTIDGNREQILEWLVAVQTAYEQKRMTHHIDRRKFTIVAPNREYTGFGLRKDDTRQFLRCHGVEIRLKALRHGRARDAGDIRKIDKKTRLDLYFSIITAFPVKDDGIL